MRLQDIAGLFQDYLVLGIIVLVLIAAAAGAVFGIRKQRGADVSMKQQINGRTAARGLLIVYMVIVLGATILSRTSYGYSSNQLIPFSSYRAAWYQWSVTAWQNLILNILMFVPIGFLLTFVPKKKPAFYKVCIGGFLISLLIEFIQFISNRGLTEVDDLINNTIGAMIGYGFALALMRIKSGSFKKIWLPAQIPLVVTICLYAGIFIRYETMSYGTFAYQDFSESGNIDIQVTEEIENTAQKFDEEHDTQVSVYLVETYTEDELQEMAQRIFDQYDAEIASDETEHYENTVIFRAYHGENTYIIWLDYMGAGMWFTDFQVDSQENSTTLEQSAVEDILTNYGIELPEQAVMKANEEYKSYTITVYAQAEKDSFATGSLGCEITADGEVRSIRNYISQASACGTLSVITAEEALKEVEKGNYCLTDSTEVNLMVGREISEEEAATDETPDDEVNALSQYTITGMTLSYALDSKGYYRPVYVFMTDQTECIIVPAENAE